MGEKTKKEERQALAIVILVGLLVILLGVVVMYSLNSRKELKRASLENNKQQSDTILELNTVNDDKVEQNTNKTDDNIKLTEPKEAKVYTCSDLKGKYTAKATLDLFEDGTYDYEENSDAAYGYYGTYTIDGDKIILNQMFSHGSDVGVSPEKKQINGTINKDGSITLKLKETTTFNKKSSSNSDSYGSLYEAVKGYIKYLEEKAQ
mgnify:FL=1